MKKSRRSQLLQHIAEITSIAIANKEYTGINTDAFTISLDLNLDRANVSRMLNDLWRENILMCIRDRYMDKYGLDSEHDSPLPKLKAKKHFDA